jgi:hypothetical protein
MRSRCAWCGSIAEAEKGEFVDVKPAAGGASKLFKCPDCLAGQDESVA